jgi:HSP20 family protein
MKNFWKKVLNIKEDLLEEEGQEVEVAYKNKKKENKSFSKAKTKKSKIKPEPESESGWLTKANQGQLVVDVYDQGDEIVIESTIGGIKPKDIDVTVEPDLIVIRGKREKQEEVNSSQYYYQECIWGSFSRTLILPVAIKPEKVKANLKNGLLTIKLPKVEEGNKEIEVKE